MTPHELLGFNYGPDGDDVLRRKLVEGVDSNLRSGPHEETPLHVAARRRHAGAVAILLEHGADIDATTAGGKTAYAHAARRGFDEVEVLLAKRGADTVLNEADRFAVAVVTGRLDEARAILEIRPGVARPPTPEPTVR